MDGADGYHRGEGRGALVRLFRWSMITLIVAVLVLPVAVPPLTGTRWIVVTGGSMEPTLSIGDVLVTRPVDDATSLRVGDIVTIEDADGLYTHGVVELGQETVRTQGDANETPDAEAVPRDAVVAQTVGHLASPWSRVVTSTRTLAARLLLAGLLVALVAPSWGRVSRRGQAVDR